DPTEARCAKLKGVVYVSSRVCRARPNAAPLSQAVIQTGRFDPARSRETRPSCAAVEVQLMDDGSSPPSEHGTESLYRYKRPTTNPTWPAAEWNAIEVTCNTSRITVRLIGQTILEADQSELPDVKTKPTGAPAPNDRPRRGYVALQSHSGRVEFRKVQVR